jgi:2,3-dihydroxybenzoate decarboxylase
MDYPYQFQADEVAVQDAMAMSAEDKKAFFQTNAEKVFGLRDVRCRPKAAA